MKLKLKKPKTTIVISLLLIILLLFIIETLHTSQDEILEEAIYLKEKQTSLYDQVDMIFYRLKYMDFSRRKVLCQKFGVLYLPDNFSYFFVTLRPGMPNKYDFDFSPSRYVFDKCSIFAEKHNTAVRLEDITDQNWKWDGDKFSGSFTFETPYGLKGRCLFEGKDKRITKMVLAKKGSDRFEDGYAVFGCNHGRNVFQEEIYDESIRLPLTLRGEYITCDKFDPISFVISVRNDCSINTGGRICSLESVKIIFKNALKDYGKSIVYFRIDKDCPKEKSDVLVNLAKEYNAEIYQVFWSEEQGTQVVKKIE